MMSEYAPGTRVCIIQDCRKSPTATGATGVYEGHFPIDGDGFLNPRICLDNGDIIWGAECWWSPVDEMPELAEAQELLEEHKANLRRVLREGPADE